jgi:hypothetical protein
MQPKLLLIVLGPLFLVLLLAEAARGDQPAGGAPFQRTETREPCANYVPTKQPFFGETHLHTAYSFDAVAIDSRNTPAEAYAYAKGGRIGLPPWADTSTQGSTPSGQRTLVTGHDYCMPGEHCEFMATRTIQFPEGRALDFAAITDHAEQFGESNICTFEATEACASDGDCDAVNGQKCFIPAGQQSGLCKPRGYDSTICVAARDELSRLRQGAVPGIIAGFENVAENPRRPPFCGPNGAQCSQQAKLVWDKIQSAANDAYDRSSACTFTSLIGYEYTAMAANGRCADADALPCWDEKQNNAVPNQPDAGQPPSKDCPSGAACIMNFTGSSGADNLHRNVIFRNEQVVDRPLSNVESPLGCGYGQGCTSNPGSPVASPAAMLQKLQEACIDNPLKPNCDVLTIPHNPNMSRGSMFILPADTPAGLAEAILRQRFEPLVEITQIKGQSECRYNAKTGMAWTNPPDELCAFENEGWARLGGDSEGYLSDALQTTDSIPPRSYVRNTLENGIAYAARNGVNPFQLGFVGGLDNHNGTPGQSDAGQYAKSGAHGVWSFATSAEALSERFFLGIETNAGGLTVAWAEENSRDAIFTALKNRETYATSGTRPIVRVFGGFGLSRDLCRRGDFAARGYAAGVPMGGTLQGPGTGAAPSLAVSALMDPGWPGHPGTALERAQIIKGWVDAGGETHEAVYDVAGKASDRPPRAQVDLRTCKPRVRGKKELCAVWTDPAFNPNEHAFYYVRVLENASCRWTQHYCNARGINCSKPMGICRTTNRALNGKGCNSNAQCGGSGVCTLPESYEEYEYTQCCSGIVPQTVQQRAWTSPIWYSPAASASGSPVPGAEGPSLAGR